MKKALICAIACAVMCFAAVTVSAGEYNLEEYLTLVERNNPDLLARFKDVELAKAGISMARSAFLPSAGVQGGYNRNFIERKQDMAVGQSDGGPTAWMKDIRTNYDNELTLGIGISQTLFNAGALSNYNKAKIAQALREQSLEATRTAVLCAAKKLYARAQLMHLVVEIRESSERFSHEQYQRVERRNQVGAATEMDLLLAEVDWRSKTDTAREAKKNSELVLLALRDLANIPHTEAITLTQVRTDLPDVPESPNFGSVLAGRADYLALVLSRELADTERKAARNAFMPEVTASFNYALVGMIDDKFRDKPMDNKDIQSAALGINVRIPILTGGARLARVKAAQLEQEKTLIALSQKETAIESELIELLLRLDDARQRHESSYRTVETARRAVALAQAAYTNGQATYLSVIDAQDKLDLVWLNFANIGFEYLSAYYDWELAAGIK